MSEILITCFDELSYLCFYVSIISQILIRNRATELDARMNDGTTPLILAARLAVEGMVEELIHCHADINAVDDHGQKTCYTFIFYLWSLINIVKSKALLGSTFTTPKNGANVA